MQAHSAESTPPLVDLVRQVVGCGDHARLERRARRDRGADAAGLGCSQGADGRAADRQVDAGGGLAAVEDAALAQPRIVEPGVEDLLEVHVGDHQVLLEQAPLGQRLTLLVDDQARAVEHDLVLAPHQVAVGHHDQVVGGARAQHALARLGLAGVVGGGRDVDDDLGAAADDLLLDRAAREPDVLADADADHGAAAREHRVAGRGHEVAVLVEHAVVGQVALAVGAHQATVVEHGGGVVEVDVAVHRADHHRHAHAVGQQRVGHLDRALDERGLEQQVLGRVARDHHLGQREHLDAERAGTLDRAHDPLEVPIQVADRGIELGETETQFTHGRAIVELCAVPRKNGGAAGRPGGWKRKRPAQAGRSRTGGRVRPPSREKRGRAALGAVTPASVPIRRQGPHWALSLLAAGGSWKSLGCLRLTVRCHPSLLTCKSRSARERDQS